MSMSSSTSATASASGHSQPTQAERTADARKAFLKSLHQASAEVDSELQTRAKMIHENSVVLKKQESNALNEAKRLAKENDNAEKWAAKNSKKMAELEKTSGDFEGLEALEADLGDVEAMLDLLEGKQAQKTSQSAGGSLG